MGNSPSKLAKLSEPTRPLPRNKGVPNKLLQLKFIEERKPFSLYKYRMLCRCVDFHDKLVE